MNRLPARKTLRRALALLITLAAVPVATATTAAGEPTWDSSTRPTTAGPPYVFTTALMDGRQVGKPLTNVAVINRTEHGYVYRAGSQDNHLVVTRVRGGLRFADSATRRFKHLAPTCRRARAKRGVAAVCRVPKEISTRQPLLVEVWPRIGDDFLDTSKLPATFAVTMLGDLGHDVARFGPGADFFNGHSGRDRVWGGAGEDWIRAGDDADRIFGGSGNDYLVGMNHADQIRGGDGDDRLFGMDGNDRLYPGAGTDRASCSTGIDLAWVDANDWVRDCETVTRD
ncbi:MAG TPA: calcium-binding protein [Nocardioidaceae bacterium]|nr:calcium-binding protein [Nocardioidaceae bacterium]